MATPSHRHDTGPSHRHGTLITTLSHRHDTALSRRHDIDYLVIVSGFVIPWIEAWMYVYRLHPLRRIASTLALQRALLAGGLGGNHGGRDVPAWAAPHPRTGQPQSSVQGAELASTLTFQTPAMQQQHQPNSRISSTNTTPGYFTPVGSLPAADFGTPSNSRGNTPEPDHQTIRHVPAVIPVPGRMGMHPGGIHPVAQYPANAFGPQSMAFSTTTPTTAATLAPPTSSYPSLAPTPSVRDTRQPHVYSAGATNATGVSPVPAQPAPAVATKDAALMRIAAAAQEDLWNLATGPGWRLDFEREGVVVSTIATARGKAFKAEGLICAPPEGLFRMLHDECTRQPEWNTALARFDVVRTIDARTDITYSVTTPQGGGLVRWCAYRQAM